MSFGEVLTRAWEIIWKHKMLWLFGLLASLAGGSGGDFQSTFRFQNNDLSSRGYERFFPNLPAWVIVLAVLVGLILVIVFILISTIGRAGLVRGAWLADEGESGLTFSRLFHEGQGYFVRVLLLGILIFVLGIAVFLIILVPTVLTLGLALICLVPLLCLMVPAFMLFSVIVDLAIVAIVGEDRGVIEGLQRAWEITRSHLGEILGMALILWIAGLIVSFIIGLPAMIVLIPLMGAFVGQSSDLFRSGAVIGMILFVLYLPILLAFRAVIQSYLSTTWTVAFRRLTGRTAGSGGVSMYTAPVTTEI